MDRLTAVRVFVEVADRGSLTQTAEHLEMSTAMVSLGHGRYRLDGVPRMRERPIQDLLDALQQLAA